MKINNNIASVAKNNEIFNKMISNHASLMNKTEDIELNIFTSAFEDLRKSLTSTEKSSKSVMINKKTDLVELVTSLSEAEAKLRIVINVRDALISSLQEIMRMQI